MWRKHVIESKLLLPEAQRPTGFRQRAKAAALMTSYPRFVFELQTSFPKHIQVGAQLFFVVKAEPLLSDRNNTSRAAPDVEITNYIIKLKAITNVRSETASRKKVDDADSVTIYR